MGFADRGIVPRAISAIYSEAIKSVLIKSGILFGFAFSPATALTAPNVGGLETVFFDYKVGEINSPQIAN